MRGGQNVKTRVAVTDPTFVKYDQFEVGDEKSKYKLQISGFTGNQSVLPHALEFNNNKKFTTIDQDNDDYRGGNCATYLKKNCGGWWYGACTRVNLNGDYKFVKERVLLSIRWSKYQPTFVEMKFRRNLK